MNLCWTFYPDYHLMLGGIDICSILNSSPGRAKAWQGYVASFVLTGGLNEMRGSGIVEWGHFGDGGNVLSMDGREFKMGVDGVVPVDRCGFWQPAPYCQTCGL